MRILLVGEFSGVHNNLKKGLVALGHDVKLAADGDGYRKFGFDYRIAPYNGRYWGKLLNILYFIYNYKKFINYDIIQFISPFSIPTYYYCLGLTHFLFSKNKKKVYYACGTDPAFIDSRDKFDYFPFEKINSTEMPIYSTIEKFLFKNFLKKIDIIVPSMYTYAIGFINNPKLGKPIPLPAFNDSLDTIKTTDYNKIKILFGITRKEFKGAAFISKALEDIKAKLFENVEIKLVEKISFTDYSQILINYDILVDQCKSYDYGMNAILAMEKGIVVLSGAEEIAMNYLGSANPPIINIKPDSDQIYNQILKLINDRNLDNIKEKSKRYVNEAHSIYLVSNKFQSLYNSI